MEKISSVEQLEDMLSAPSPGVIETMRRLEGDILILGVGGKMGPTLARMARRASDIAGVKRRIIGVSRFSSPKVPDSLRQHGIEPITADLLDRQQLAKLPDVPNIVFMAGMKFGSTNQEPLTWAMNCYLPGMVCERYKNSRIVAFSTGNVYGLTPASASGSRETDPLNPLGDYAMSCRGRERIFDHFSRALNIPTSILRLNYAIELRYGVLVDLARRVWNGEQIDVSMGYVNVIWQAEASAMSLMSFDRAASPAFILNVAGAEILRVRDVATRFAELMKKDVTFTGVESPDALLNDGRMGHRLFGSPQISADMMMHWIADWTMRGGATLGKPTHFEARNGKF
jgi:nucleoside-diphosphate-sugar epimerase